MTYKGEIEKAMIMLGKRKNAIFLGQSVKIPGNLLYNSLNKVSNSKKLELPIFEDTQMGISIGMSLNGFLPVSCYPRFDFFILALNQLVNHLDKFQKVSSNEFKPFVIIRVLVGSKKPIDAGLQHTQNYYKEIKSMLKYIDVINLKKTNQIFNSYKKAVNKRKSTVFVEYSEKY